MSIPKIFPDPYLRKGVTLACVFLFPPRPLPHCFLYWPRVQLSPQHTLGRKAHQKSPATQASVTLVLVEFYSETYMKDTQTCLWKGEVELLYNLFLFTNSSKEETEWPIISELFLLFTVWQVYTYKKESPGPRYLKPH